MKATMNNKKVEIKQLVIPLIEFLCLMALCFLSTSSFAIMKGLSTDELTKASDIVISGEVENTESHWSKDGKTIFTTAYITVDDVVKGVTTQRKIAVEYEGGEVGGIGLRVSDQTALTKGEKVILFLKSGKSHRDGNVYNIVGNNQGKYVIGADGIARKGGYSVAGDKENIDNNIPADKLIERIKRAEK